MISPPPPPPPLYTVSQQPQKLVNNNLVHNILSYDSNIMLAAIISLLLVILFVLLLHVYAKWFLVQAARQGSRRAVSVGSRFHHFHTFSVETTFANSPTKGLDPEDISSIPLFVYKIDNSDDHKHGLECVICLSLFENDDVGRKLEKCNHAFHVECIDMWLNSHVTCPICRAPVVSDGKVVESTTLLSENGEVLGVLDQELMSETTTLDDLRRCSNFEDSGLEIVVEVPSSSGHHSPCSSSSTQAPSLGASLKRMMSRNRSEQRKVFPSGNIVVEANVSEQS